MKTYITMKETHSFVPFATDKRDTMVVVTCNTLHEAFFCFVKATGNNLYCDVTLSTIRPVITPEFKEDAIDSDTFILTNI